jgi:hypothetical protein
MHLPALEQLAKVSPELAEIGKPLELSICLPSVLLAWLTQSKVAGDHLEESHRRVEEQLRGPLLQDMLSTGRLSVSPIGTWCLTGRLELILIIQTVNKEILDRWPRKV